MDLLSQAASRIFRLASPRALASLLFAAMATLIPSLALAAGGENVVLNFTNEDKLYLAASALFGVFALLAAWVLTRKVKALSPGSEAMQRVGGAIREGALAYLQRQVRTMLIFVLLLAGGLFALYQGHFGTTVGIWIAVAFVMGVAASYIAGYAGMLMAISGNMRTANAALTSMKRALEVAFRSGAVAGLVTVGMGLLGATAILYFGGQDAMRILIGFGFGGSLAALFMRVGGGIFTKAADVGADLVGKVEAGIPEDDPRNPATIADNVGDNVGDCAGMAADVFESYEVTLVAAIILGAATASIFDQQTWMRLVLFALMARGVGILASIWGIFSVRGTDNVDEDPLRRIRKGFYNSAGVAAVLTGLLAWWMMGGPGSQSSPIKTTSFTSLDELRETRKSAILAAREDVAREKRIPVWELQTTDLAADRRIKALNIREGQEANVVQGALEEQIRTEREKTPTTAAQVSKGFTPLDFGSQHPALNYTVIRPQYEPRDYDFKKDIVTVRELYGPSATKDDQLVLAVVKQTFSIPPQQGQPTQPPQVTRTLFGPAPTKALDNMFKNVPAGSVQVERRIPVRLYANPQGELALGIQEQPEGIMETQPTVQGFVPYYWTQPPDTIRPIAESNQRATQAGQPMKPLPPPHALRLGVVDQAVVPWWTFLAAIAFGILMAFAIEGLTDYYVSTHKKPVQEVAGVSTAGPAPMIIQGFAYAAESSVFMVFAIVIALLFPLFIFSPALYGGYILSFYGIALVGLGLLTTTGYVLAMDTFGPISDNAQGVYEMSGDGRGNEYGSKAVQRLDAAGNTTKALTKGFAIATAVVAAVALFHSYLETANLDFTAIGQLRGGLPLDYPEIFLGLLIGGAAPYLFSAFAINAVGRSSFQLINEVRRQFREDPGILAGRSKPNYGRCVSIVTAAAQKELLGPGILAIALPAAVAFGFSIGKEPVSIGGQLFNLTGAQALGGYLVGAILSGQLMAVLLANSGGMWDNSKKLIEDGLYGGKGTDAHKAGVVCDTVGDPFKDTAGPALNPLIKVMNLVALLLAPQVIQPYSNTTLIIITAAAVLALAFSVYFSKKGSLSSSLQEAQGAGAAAAVHAFEEPGKMEHSPIHDEARRRITVEGTPSQEDVRTP